MSPQRPISRREALKLLAAAGLVSPFAGGMLPLPAFLSPRALAQATSDSKLLQVFLLGGWDAHLATDPVLPGSAQALSGAFEPAYYTPLNASYPGAAAFVSGKSNVRLGPGLAAARTALGQASVAVVNGLFVEVTAHELAVNYLYSGKLSLSRSREYPAAIATLADKIGGFPAHVVLGAGIPLGETVNSNPPLVSSDAETLAKALAGPYKSDFEVKRETIDAGHELLAILNTHFQARLAANERGSLGGWNASEAGLTTLYAKRFDQKLGLSSALRLAFGAAANDDVGARLATAAQCLKEGVTRFATVTCDGFDTHQTHFVRHLPPMQQVAAALAGLVNYLATEADPDSPSKKLLETTTVLVTSEFNRTPALNAAGGTDHWQTGAALLFGRGVRDDRVIGGTDAQGNGADYAPIGGKLLPDHLAASLLRMMGLTAEADQISEVHLGDLFT